MPKIKSDGSAAYQLQQIKAEIDNHNAAIKGEYGGRGISTVSLQKRGKGAATLMLRFSYPVTREGIQDPQQLLEWGVPTVRCAVIKPSLLLA